jgi:uncharacterized membrane protein YphA (DoxX/SURF4 family)
MSVLYLFFQIVLVIAFLLAGVSQLVGTRTQIEAFDHLGLPQWFRVFTGICLCIGVVGLIIGFWLPVLIAWSSIWLGFIMVVAGFAHIRARDSFGKAMPAFSLALIAIVLLLVNASEM